MDPIAVSSLLSKLTSVLGLAIIFFIPTQLGFHFWPLSSFVYGIRIDYLSPILYFLDCLILLFLALKRSDLVGCKPNQKPTRSDLLGVILPILLVNLLYSQNPLATLSWSPHFILYILFLATLLPPLGSDLLRKSWPSAKMFSQTSITSSETRSDPQGTIPAALTLSLLFQTLLATTQVLLGHSLGGLLYYLGERTIAVGSPTIAVATFMGRVVLRAYGTFGHPNVLAGYAIISLLIILKLSFTNKESYQSSRTLLKRNSRLQVEKGSAAAERRVLLGTLLPLLLTAILILLTQSRAAALSLFIFILPLYLLKKTKLRTLFFYFLVVAICGLSLSSSLVRDLDLSTNERLTLQGLSLSVISSFPIFGTGAQASISTYPIVDPTIRLIQPDHNSFTLFLSWFGLFGVLALPLGSDLLRKSWPSARMFSRTSKTNSETRSDPQGIIATFIPLVPLLLLDHYLLTSPQGLFILLLYLYVAVN